MAAASISTNGVSSADGTSSKTQLVSTPCSVEQKKIGEKILLAQKRNVPFYSFEYFPPKSDAATKNLIDRISRMELFDPLFIDLTESKASNNLQLCQQIQQNVNINAIMPHLTMTDRTKVEILHFLDTYKKLGIRNILALRGDPLPSCDSWEAREESLEHACDLVKLIRREHGDWFHIAVGGYPEGHPNSESLDQDIKHLKAKVDAGADSITTQFFYDSQVFFNFVDKCRDAGIKVPIIPGFMPIQTYGTFVRIVSHTNVHVPESVWQALQPIKANDTKVKEYGIKYCTQLCKDVLNYCVRTQKNPMALHFYTFNLERSVTIILEKLNLLYLSSHASDAPNNVHHNVSNTFNNVSNTSQNFQTIATSAANDANDANNSNDAKDANESKPNGSNNLKAPDASKSSKNVNVNENGVAGLGSSPTGVDQFPWQGAVGIQRRTQETVRPIFWSNRNESYIRRTQHWDEYPNGRWGDNRSPAYGEFPNHYLLRHGRSKALRSIEYRQGMWQAELKKFEDIYDVFVRYLSGDIKQLPWCMEPIKAETSEYLLETLKLLNKFGFLTINSQPQVNGARSDDKIVGWGPQNGYVYQKAYLEFFVSRDRLDLLLKVIEKDANRRFQSLLYQAVSRSGDLRSNCEVTDVNAVTWGVFPGSEIVQPTIVDTESFLAWKDEAFALWRTYWQSIYQKGSNSYQLIDTICKDWYLVNIVENDYVCGNIFGVFEEYFETAVKDEKELSEIKAILRETRVSRGNNLYCKAMGPSAEEIARNRDNPYLDTSLLQMPQSECKQDDKA